MLQETASPIDCEDEEVDLTGSLVAGKWRLDARIGRGSFGDVWSARHVVTGGTRAVKLLDPSLSRMPDVRERFVREAQASSRIESADVVSIDDVGYDDQLEQPYLIMELLRGETLREFLDRAPGRMAPEEVVFVTAQIASALDAAHRAGIVHRDLKPENVFLTWLDDGSVCAKLLDFGIAKLTDHRTGRYMALDANAMRSEGQTTGFLGTPGYSAPEQIRDASSVGPTADVFSLGICAFEMLTGGCYWRAESTAGMLLEILDGIDAPASQRAPEPTTVPSFFDVWFATACAADPTRRFASPGAAVEVLATALKVGAAVSPARRASHGDARQLPSSLAATVRRLASPIEHLAWMSVSAKRSVSTRATMAG